MVRTIYKGIGIEININQHEKGHWTCASILIKFPAKPVSIEYQPSRFQTTFDLTLELALGQAQAAIDAA